MRVPTSALPPPSHGLRQHLTSLGLSCLIYCEDNTSAYTQRVDKKLEVPGHVKHLEQCPARNKHYAFAILRKLRLKEVL